MTKKKSERINEVKKMVNPGRKLALMYDEKPLEKNIEDGILKYFVIYFLDRKAHNTRFGIAVGTKIGNAVTRNKLKRRIREIIEETKTLFQKDKDYIIMVRNECLNLNYHEMKENLINLIK